jgi:predicted nucleotidyltransferase
MEAVTGLRVDLVTEGGLSPYIRDRVLAEAVAV